MRKTVIAAAASVLFAAAAHAQTAAPTTPAPAPPPQYGQPGVTLEQATAAVVAAAAEAKKNGWFLAIAVVSNGGHLVHFSKMDQTQFALGADRDRQGQGRVDVPQADQGVRGSGEVGPAPPSCRSTASSPPKAAFR